MKIKIGVCCGPDSFRTAKECGFDYVEVNFRVFTMNDGEYEKILAAKDAVGIPVEAANCFLPGELPVSGPDIDYEGLRAFLEKGFERAHRLGISTVVFGSGGARPIPEGYTYSGAAKDIIRVTKRYIAPAAAKYGIEVAFEPLAYNESDTINSIAEGCALAAAVDEKNISCIADLYHMYCVGDTYEELRKLGSAVTHGHLANPTVNKNGIKRYYPLDINEYDYEGFFSALISCGVERVSLEARTDDFDRDVRISAEIMKQLAVISS